MWASLKCNTQDVKIVMYIVRIKEILEQPSNFCDTKHYYKLIV